MTNNQILTPYQAAKRINAEGLTTKQIAPQQLYGDVRKNKIVSKLNEVGTLTVKWSDVEAWIAEFNAKQAKKAAKASTTTEA